MPSVYEEFVKDDVFSTIAMDQAHEQMHDLIKGDGGIIGITVYPSALIQWITAGPEIARTIEDFENLLPAIGSHHHG